MQLLDAPSVLDEARGEVVEQLRMTGRLGHHAQIVRRGHEALPEMMLPDAVHQHARRERIVRDWQWPGPAPAGRCPALNGASGRHSTSRNWRGTTGPVVARLAADQQLESRGRATSSRPWPARGAPGCSISRSRQSP